MFSKRARKIKVKIVAEGKRIWIPSLPFWLIKAAARILLVFVNKKIKKANDNAVKMTQKDIMYIINELTSHGKFILADIEVKEDNTKVYIEVK